MEILNRIDSLARREHDATVELIEALLLCDRLRAHLDAGYSSLFDLLVRRLRYSNAAAARRIGAMRCARRTPRVLELLRARRTNLTVLAKIESTLAACDDPDGLLDAIADRSQSEVESLLAARRPVDRPKERVRKIATRPVPPPAAPLLATETESVPIRSAAEVIATDAADRSNPPDRTDPDTPAAPQAVPEPRVTLSFSVREEDFAAFERACAELAKKLPRAMSLEDAFNALVRSFLSRRTPKRPREAPKPPAERTRHVPAATRRAVLARDGHRCSFVAADGTRCAATRYLEIDHVVPFAQGGSHDASNLRVLCRAHNQRAAERVFGPPPRPRA